MLAFNPQSAMHAMVLGGLKWRGWDVNSHVTANVHDVIASMAAGLSGKRGMPDNWKHPRPVRDDEKKKMLAPTLAEINVDGFLRMIHSD